MNKLLLGSGYYDDGSGWASWYHSNIWLPCALRYSPNKAIKIIAVGGSVPAIGEISAFVRLAGNLGHIHNTLGKTEPRKDHRFCGWSATLIALAMLAYNDEADLLFMEQDCVAFGPIVSKMYEELGDGGMIFGGSKTMPCAQSLILIKHEFIPEFVIAYMTGADERRLGDLPEMRFRKMMQRMPGKVRQFSFGVDRDRPLPIGAPVWYAQKLAREELLALREAGIICFEGEPPTVEVFTGKS